MTEPRDDVQIKIKTVKLRNKTKIMATCLGCPLSGHVPPMCDSNDPLNFRQAVVKRVARKVPDIKNKRKFRDSVRKFINKFPPVPAKEWEEFCKSNCGMEYWLSRNNSYNQARKQEIRQAKKEKLDPKDLSNKAFIKTEFYDNWKIARLINACMDAYKAETGGFVSVIGHWFFAFEEAIKNVPVNQRPAYIVEKLGKFFKWLSSDYTSFEAHMTKDMQDMVEMTFYAHMSKNFSDTKKRTYFLDLIREKQTKRQKCTSKLGSYSINATRMSGDMTTSLGNTITNLAIINYVMECRGIKYKMIAEGDDAIIGLERSAPDLKPSDFEEAGAILKVVPSTSVGRAGFCGLIFDEKEKENLTDPWYALATTGWTSANAKMGGPKVLSSLLTAKAYSLAFSAPQNPVTRALADSILRINVKIKPRFGVEGNGHLSWKDEHIFAGYDVLNGVLPKLPPRKFTDRSFQLVEEVFGMSRAVQERYVNYFDTVKVIQTIPVFGDFNRPDWKENYWLNVRTCEAGRDPNSIRYVI